MMHRPFDEQAIYGSSEIYKDWKPKALKARDDACAAVRAGQKPDFETIALWGRLKPDLLTYFDQKCAYCEHLITSGDHGDVEHYRPKRGVTGQDHPGYYWLAYDPENLMPSCILCNRGKGKRNQFPVADGQYQRNELEKVEESPLLLNPYIDRPTLHLRYLFNEEDGRPTGYMEAISPQGAASISIYHLNREMLKEERRVFQDYAVTEHLVLLAGGQKGDAILKKILHDGKPHSMARYFAIKNYLAWNASQTIKTNPKDQ